MPIVRFPLLVLLLVTCLGGASNIVNAKSPAGNPGLRSASALVINSSGQVIYGKDIATIRPIASITKLMTAMVTKQCLCQGSPR